MRRIAWLLICASAAAGCGGEYVLTVPDQIAPVGGEVKAVVRLERNEIFSLATPVAEAVLRLRIGTQPARAAYTDSIGYAGTLVPAPAVAGRYPLSVLHTDNDGDEATATGAVYVWDPARPIVAVDLDALLAGRAGFATGAKAALETLSGKANIIYLTRQPADRHKSIHAKLAAAAFADGPVLLWQRKYWRLVRKGWYKLPRFVMDSRLVSQLAELRKDFPNLECGVCDSRLAARAFGEAGMECIVIGPADVASQEATRYDTWADFAASGR